jgi:hypothetical protein
MFDAVLLWIGPDGRTGHAAKVIESGSLARVEVLGRNVGIEMVRHDNQWFLLFAPDRMSEDSLDAYQQMLKEVNKEFERIIEGIHNGTVTEENIDNVLSGIPSKNYTR